MLSPELIRAAVAASRKVGLDAAITCAIIEKESAGRALEQDGVTPFFLFERHVFYAELAARAPGKLAKACAQGLAHKAWSPATQYKDQGSSAARLALIAKARAVDEDCANRSASWGVGQTMGFHAEKLGYANATQMVAALASLEAQVDAMLGEITKNAALFGALVAHNWPTAARLYNGPGYAVNHYDTDLAAGFARWSRRLAAGDPAATAPSPERVRTVQRLLREKGYGEVGTADGAIGTRTVGALAAFRHDAGLPPPADPAQIDDALVQALTDFPGRPQPSIERRAATAETLRAAGSQTIKDADAISTGATVTGGAAAIGAADKVGLFDQVKGWAGELGALNDLVAPLRDVWQVVLDHWYVGAALGGFVLWRLAKRIELRRVVEHQLGINTGR